MLGLVPSILLGWEERLRNDLFCAEWNVKPELNQSTPCHRVSTVPPAHGLNGHGYLVQQHCSRYFSRKSRIRFFRKVYKLQEPQLLHRNPAALHII